MKMYQDKVVVGVLELCNLPDLTIDDLNIRVDTGAATSSLHVDNIDEFEKNGTLWVSFDIHPDIHDVTEIVRREARVESVKTVKSSTATREKRYYIKTPIQMAGQTWDIHLTLTDRSEMTYLMLLGREAMADRLVVDPSAEYLLGSNK